MLDRPTFNQTNIDSPIDSKLGHFPANLDCINPQSKRPALLSVGLNSLAQAREYFLANAE